MIKFNFFIFDFDGTLCDTNSAVEYCIIKALEEFNEPYDKKILNTIISQGLNLHDTFSKLVKPEHIIKLVETYRIIYNSGKGIEKSRLYPKVHEVFDFLKSNDATILIVSNKGLKAVSDALKFFKLESYIDFCIAEMPGVKKKPDPMIYNEVIKNKYVNLNNKNVLMIGDTESDINFASNSFISSCWAKYGYGNAEKCIKLKSNYQINSFISILKIL